MNILDKAEALIGERPLSATPLEGGEIGLVYHLSMADGSDLVIKTPRPGIRTTMEIEARMLGYLANHSHLPIPQVHHVAEKAIIMSYLPSQPGLTREAQEDAARHIAELHAVKSDKFGLPFDTVIGTLAQPNAGGPEWVPFFTHYRLLYMAKESLRVGRITESFYDRLHAFAEKLPDLIGEPSHPSLVHGDLWTGNVLVNGDEISGFVDPAIYFGHSEMDLAFSMLFGTFGQTFFDAYRQYRAIEPGFFEERKDIYNLWPLLVHVRLFGGSYQKSVSNIIARFGC